MTDYREAIKTEAKRGFAGNFEGARNRALVAADPDTVAIATKYNKDVYDVASDIIAVRLSSDRERAA